ncbi:unnamed protein product [Ectocarpus sp. 13 AM-2016]
MPAGLRHLCETDRTHLAKQMIEEQLKPGEKQIEESRVALKRQEGRRPCTKL